MKNALWLVVALAAFPAAGETIERTLTPMPPATLAELAAVPARALPHESPREHRRLETTVRAATLPTAQSRLAAAPTAVSAPPPVSGFESARDVEFAPADAAGAVGPNHVVGFFNEGMRIHDRSGKLLASLSLAQFWNGSTFVGAYYDPRIYYDKVADRWVAVALYDERLLRSTYLIAASATGDPTGAWVRYRMIADPSNVWVADFTRLAATNDSIVIVADALSNFTSQAEVLMIPKSELYQPAGSFPKLTQSRLETEIELLPVTVVDGTPYTTPLLVTAEGGSHGRIIIYSFTPATGLRQQANIQSQLAFTGGLFVAPQLGSSRTIDAGRGDIQDALLRDGVIWAVQTTDRFAEATERVGIHWWRIPLDFRNVEDGMIEDPAGAVTYAYPSIAVNKAGAALIGYSIFSAKQYASSGYSYRDPSGAMSAPTPLKNGEAVYLRDRWGDYSATLVDPVNDLDFWTVQSWAVAGPTSFGAWSTWWARISATPAGRARPIRRR